MSERQLQKRNGDESLFWKHHPGTLRRDVARATVLAAVAAESGAFLAPAVVEIDTVNDRVGYQRLPTGIRLSRLLAWSRIPWWEAWNGLSVHRALAATGFALAALHRGDNGHDVWSTTPGIAGVTAATTAIAATSMLALGAISMPPRRRDSNYGGNNCGDQNNQNDVGNIGNAGNDNDSDGNSNDANNTNDDDSACNGNHASDDHNGTSDGENDISGNSDIAGSNSGQAAYSSWLTAAPCCFFHGDFGIANVHIDWRSGRPIVLDPVPAQFCPTPSAMRASVYYDVAQMVSTLWSVFPYLLYAGGQAAIPRAWSEIFLHHYELGWASETLAVGTACAVTPGMENASGKTLQPATMTESSFAAPRKLSLSRMLVYGLAWGLLHRYRTQIIRNRRGGHLQGRLFRPSLAMLEREFRRCSMVE